VYEVEFDNPETVTVCRLLLRTDELVRSKLVGNVSITVQFGATGSYAFVFVKVISQEVSARLVVQANPTSCNGSVRNSFTVALIGFNIIDRIKKPKPTITRANKPCLIN